MRESESINKDVQQNPALLIPILTLGHTEVRVQGPTNAPTMYRYTYFPCYCIYSIADTVVCVLTPETHTYIE